MTKPRTLPNRWNLPDLGLGVGLRTRHFKYITEHWPAMDWFDSAVSASWPILTGM